MLWPRSKSTCDSPRSWAYSANDGKSVDIRVDVMDVAGHQTDILLSSHYNDSWSGLELDHEEAGRVECQGLMASSVSISMMEIAVQHRVSRGPFKLGKW